MMKKLRNKLHKQRGLAAIEFTLVLPFLLLLIFACAEFGRLLYHYSALNKTVRDASRYLSSNVIHGDNGNVAIKATVSADVKNLIRFSQSSETTSLFASLTDDDISLVINGNFIVITVNYDWQPIFSDTFTTFGLGDEIDLSFPLVSTYTMRAL
jgi:hypothetical protein